VQCRAELSRAERRRDLRFLSNNQSSSSVTFNGMRKGTPPATPSLVAFHH
jgi:hypothetical protein